LEQQQALKKEAIRSRLRSHKHDTPTAVIGLAGINQNSSVYGTVVFDLTLFNEITKSDNVLDCIEASVIDSCIEVIIGLPGIRKQRLIHRIPSYFDAPEPAFLEPTYIPEINTQSTPAILHMAHLVQPASVITTVHPTMSTYYAKCRGARPCDTCAPFISMGYDNTMCSATGRPYTPQEMRRKPHPSITEMDLIRKDSLLDPIEDDDDIEWPDNPYEVNTLDESSESPTELLALITIKGSPPWLQTNFKALCLELIDIFAIEVRREPAINGD